MPRIKNPFKSNVTLLVDNRIYEKYRDYCKLKGILISRQFEIMMENQMKRK
jgi:hypothetical protein